MKIIEHPSPKLTLSNLIEIKDYINSVTYCKVGICSLFNTYTKHNYTLNYCLAQADVFFKNWSEYSGSSSYPIPAYHSDGVTIGAFVHEYNLTENKWDKTNPYCQARYRLLDWLIEQVQTYVNIKEQS